MSQREEQFSNLWQRFGNGQPPEREHHFHPLREWKFDFAWLPQKVAVEIQGGTWTRGKSGHNSGAGLQADYEKQNAAVLKGWRVLFFTSSDLDKRPIQICELVTLALKG